MATITPIAQGTTKKLTDDLNSNFNNLNTELTSLKQVIIDTVYPIGSFFISVEDTEPSTLLGGTWERVKGRFLYGVDPNNRGAMGEYEVGALGGEEKHTLQVNELPKNIGTFQAMSWITESDTGAFKKKQDFADRTATTGSDMGTTTHTLSGGGAAHNNMPPYLAVNIWKRIDPSSILG